MRPNELVVLLGNSGSGKDYVAEKYFSDYKIIKLNSAFKAAFELDHNLRPGYCNDKSKREKVLIVGPYRGMTIRAAMLQAYNESLNPRGEGYGARFAGVTIVTGLNEILNSDRNVVITDLRKVSEAKILDEFCRVQLKMNIRVISIVNRYSKPLTSDLELNEVAKALGYGHLGQCLQWENHYEIPLEFVGPDVTH
jgi:hypothetical protein